MTETSPKTPLLNNSVQQSLANDSFRSRSGSFAASGRFSSQSLRKPFHYPVTERGYVAEDPDVNIAATYSRYKYYSRLSHPTVQILNIPDHVIPVHFFFPFPLSKEAVGSQSSIITIFAIWNTMMGTSLLSMPWAVAQAGFGGAIFFIIAVGALCWYTTYRILLSPQLVESIGDPEFPDVCNYFLGACGKWVGVIFSLIPLVGATIVFWVLMSTFLSHTVLYIYDSFSAATTVQVPDGSVICPTGMALLTNSSSAPYTDDRFHEIWTHPATVPLLLVFLIFPIVNLKSPTFFTKFNALGTLSVFYLMVYVLVKSFYWGSHTDFNNKDSRFYTPVLKESFPALTGVLCLSYFIHNCIISMMRYQKHPENNKRDLFIAYTLVIATYLMIGIPFYISFPLPKFCLEDNFLNNFPNRDMMAFISRIFLLVQYFTLFPMIAYLLRVQIMHVIYHVIYPGLKHVLTLNILVIAVCVLFAIFLPKIGTILRYCGALSGLVYIFSLPSIIYMVAMYKKGHLGVHKAVAHILIILLGLANFVLQFILPYLEPA